MEEEEDIDTSWIEEYKDSEKEYDAFYKDKCTRVKLFFMYVNRENTIECIKKEDYTLQNSSISRESLINIIKKTQLLNTCKYKLISLLKFNISLDPVDIEDILYAENDYGKEFLQIETNLNSIIFEDTITMFEDFNTIYFIYYPDVKPKHETKRIFFEKKTHKTRRKRA